MGICNPCISHSEFVKHSCFLLSMYLRLASNVLDSLDKDLRVCRLFESCLTSYAAPSDRLPLRSEQLGSLLVAPLEIF